MAQRLPFLFIYLAAGAALRAGEGSGYLHRIRSFLEFDRLSVAITWPPGGERAAKFMVPSKNDPSLVPAVFQNSNLYPFHIEFLVAEFPDRFAGLTGSEYLALVERRETRSYFAGVLYRFKGESGSDPLYGFDVFTLSGNAAQLPALDEARWIHARLTAAFEIGAIAYSPRDPLAIENAKRWTDPGFPLLFAFGGGFLDFVPYTLAGNYGRMKVLGEEKFKDANESGAFSSQDIVVLDFAPADIEGVIAGAITGGIQSELGHLAIRTGRRGSPNAYVRDAARLLESWNGKLVFLEVKADRYEVREATLEEAEPWWAAHRPKIEISEVDAAYDKLDAAWDVPIDGPLGGPLRLVTRYGGKGGNFARLYQLLDEPNRVPGFIIPFHYYLRFLESNRTASPLDPRNEVTFAQYIEELLAMPEFRGDSRRRFEELERLRDVMEDESEVDPELVKALKARIQEIFRERVVDRAVRFRSSSNAEDILEFNGAGLYRSTSVCLADDLDAGDGGPSMCDPDDITERTIRRGLTKVWASLWNFRAFEEREYFQIDHKKARMAILVSEGFPDERANGVAFTGNPSLIGDRRFVINAQIGDLPVVFTDPGVTAEKDVLEMVNGEASRILRLRPSSEVPAGELVLSDDNLRELGRVMGRIEKDYPVDYGTHAPDEVVLDFEWKLDRFTGRIRLKQVRPFLLSSSGDPIIPQFRRGDANSSGQVNVTDVVVVLLHQFAGGPLACADAADFDDVGSVDLDDAILLLYYLFFGLDAPAAPGPARCGEDVERDELPACNGAACL